MIGALTVVAALTSACSGAALQARQVDQIGDPYGETTGTNGDPMQDVTIFCRGYDGEDWDLGSEDGAKQAWVNTRTHLVVDKFVKEHGSYQWVKNFEKEVDPGEASSDTGSCGVVGATCGGGSEKSCEEYFERDSHPWIKNAYWVWKALDGFHAKIKALKEALLEETLFSSLEINVLIEELGGSPKEDSTFSDIAGWISQAIGIGGTLAGGANFAGATGVSTGLSILSAVAGMVAEADGSEDGVDAGTIESALSNLAGDTSNKLSTMLQLSVGLIEDEAAYEKLPAVAGSEDMETSIGTFYSNGWSLLYLNSDAAQKSVESMSRGIRAKVTDLILQEVGYILVGIDPDKLEGGCSGADGSGEYMMATNNGDQYCFYMAKPTEYNKVDYIDKAGEKIFQVMMSNGIESPYAYYQQILKCQRPRDSEEEDYQPSDELQPIGEPAPCLFNMKTAIVEEIDMCEVNLGKAGESPCNDYKLRDI